MKFLATKYKLVEDHEGEITLSLKVPQLEAENAKIKDLPVLQNLVVEITPEG